MERISVCVVGLGYIGLPTAALLASAGHPVCGVDVNPTVVDAVNRGEPHIVEPGLDVVLSAAASSGLLKADPVPRASDVFMICVPTPFHEGGDIPQPNIDYVLAATRSIAPFVRSGALIILESTSPVGTTRLVAGELASAGVDMSGVSVAYCPERVLPGRAMYELLHNDRVVGGVDDASTKAAAAFYRSFIKGKVLETNAETAEMCKLTENSFRDLNIAFANELSMICEREGINVWKLIELANHHPRVSILQPGVGVGGHCIAVDPWFIVARHPDDALLIKTARGVNIQKTHWVVEDVLRLLGEHEKRLGRKPVVACMGLSFKPDIDDLRESPAVDIVRSLKARGATVRVVEPHVESVEGFELISIDQAKKETDVMVFLVRHAAFLSAFATDWSFAGDVLDYCGLTQDA
jgi:UDP-N-acetyl-D-mannosaminuronic acid dehydrogenase